MRKLILFVMVLLLAACGPAVETATPTADEAEAAADTAVPAETAAAETAVPVDTAAPTETAAVETADPTPTETTADEPEEDAPETAVPTGDVPALEPAATVDEAAELRASDWRKGPADASVVIIEYGDFQ